MKIGEQAAMDYLSSMKKNETISLVSHNDADGLSSAALMNSYLMKWRRKKADDIIIQTMPPSSSLISRLKSYVPNRVIITDLSIVDHPIFRRVSRISMPLLIDHHSFSSIPDINAVYFNPRIKKPEIYQSASYLSYRLLSKLRDMSDRIWIAVVGIVGDYDISSSKDLLKEARKHYPEIHYDITKLFDTVFGKIAEMIAASKAYKKPDLSKLSAIMSSFSSPYEFMESRETEEYRKAAEVINHEMERVKEEIKQHIETRGKFVFYNLSSKYAIRSFVSTMLGDRYRDRIVVITEKYRGKMRVSARNQSRQYNVAELLKEAASAVGVPEAGGHPAAAGAQVPLEKWKEFKSVLISLVE